MKKNVFSIVLCALSLFAVSSCCDAPAVAVDLIYGCDFVVDLNNASAESKKTEIFVVRSSDGISWYVEENRSKTMTVLPGSSLKTTLNAFFEGVPSSECISFYVKSGDSYFLGFKKDCILNEEYGKRIFISESNVKQESIAVLHCDYDDSRNEKSYRLYDGDNPDGVEYNQSDLRIELSIDVGD
jgi:hypothetical protein